MTLRKFATYINNDYAIIEINGTNIVSIKVDDKKIKDKDILKTILLGKSFTTCGISNSNSNLYCVIMSVNGFLCYKNVKHEGGIIKERLVHVYFNQFEDVIRSRADVDLYMSLYEL